LLGTTVKWDIDETSGTGGSCTVSLGELGMLPRPRMFEHSWLASSKVISLQAQILVPADLSGSEMTCQRNHSVVICSELRKELFWNGLVFRLMWWKLQGTKFESLARL
jgi:hypothetical protein